MASRRPSSLTVRSTVPAATSRNSAVIRTRSPRRWKAPVTIHVAPTRRPTTRPGGSPPPACAEPASVRVASSTCARPITVMPFTFWRSAVTVSAMPDPIHSSAGSPRRFAKVRTATPRSGRVAGAIPSPAEDKGRRSPASEAGAAAESIWRAMASRSM